MKQDTEGLGKMKAQQLKIKILIVYKMQGH
jgi:hypothetical protein